MGLEVTIERGGACEKRSLGVGSRIRKQRGIASARGENSELCVRKERGSLGAKKLGNGFVEEITDKLVEKETQERFERK